MRTLGPGSVSSFLKIILDVTWYALWVLIGFLALAGLAALLLSFNSELIEQIEFRTDLGEEPGQVGPMLAAALFAGALYMGGVLLIVGNLRRIFQTLTAGDPFHPDNVGRLRFIGLVLAGLELGRWVFWGSITMLLPNVNQANGNLSLTTWFSVMVVFVLAEVFREGARLRREAELTI
ncbi:MAG TPA: DUF2975 domain-containing protein [Caulobacter sp.]|nr:DUF2975 domain-containing protein [Caulobacter sp.]